MCNTGFAGTALITDDANQLAHDYSSKCEFNFLQQSHDMKLTAILGYFRKPGVLIRGVNSRLFD
jgi:hypothetical protein